MTKTAGDTPQRSVRSVLAQSAGLLLALLLLPAALAIGVPLAAWAIAFALVLANRLVHWGVAWFVRDASMTVALSTMAFAMMFRALATVLVLFFIGASIGSTTDNPIGLKRPDLARPAVLIFMLCFTLDAGIEFIRRAGEREQMLATEPPATSPETTA